MSSALNRTTPRPGRLTVLAVVFLAVSMVGFIRFVWLVTGWKETWQITGPSIFWYETNTSFACGIGSLIVAWMVWSGSRIGGYAATTWTILVSAGIWADRLIVMVNPTSRENGLFLLLINLLVLVWVFGCVYSKPSHDYLGREKNG